MEVYRRNINALLFLHRVLVLLIVVSAMYFLYNNMVDYAWFSLIILIIFLPFPLTTIIVSGKEIIIRKIFFGFLPMTYTFSLKPGRRTVLSIEKIEVESNPGSIDTGTFLNLFLLFLPGKKMIEKYLLLYNYHEAHKKLRIRLTEEEHDLVAKLIASETN